MPTMVLVLYLNGNNCLSLNRLAVTSLSSLTQVSSHTNHRVDYELKENKGVRYLFRHFLAMELFFESWFKGFDLVFYA